MFVARCTNPAKLAFRVQSRARRVSCGVCGRGAQHLRKASLGRERSARQGAAGTLARAAPSPLRAPAASRPVLSPFNSLPLQPPGGDGRLKLRHEERETTRWRWAPCPRSWSRTARRVSQPATAASSRVSQRKRPQARSAAGSLRCARRGTLIPRARTGTKILKSALFAFLMY